MKLTIDNYDIILSTNNIESFTLKIKEISKTNKLFVVTDSTVNKLHYKALFRALSTFEVVCVISNNKSFESYNETVNQLLENGITKNDLLIAFGGGTVGDLTGLIAATLFRGMDYIQIPTTLLAQIDSSIGGKTAIDTKFGKNLIGAFHNPKLVLIDSYFLETLPLREYNNGLAEAIKMSLLFDYKLYLEIKSKEFLTLEDIFKILNYKKEIVLKDPFDQNIRQLLNFGHTFGHAIEKTNNYETFKHGEAISHGMILALKLGIKLNITNQDILDDVTNELTKRNLLISPISDYKTYLKDLKYDKKNTDKGLNFILLKNIGEPLIVNLKLEDL